MRFASVRELKNETSMLLRVAADGKDVLITNHGKPVAVLHGLTEDEIEDYVLSRHPGFRRELKEAYDTYRKRGGVSLERMTRKLERKRGRV